MLCTTSRQASWVWTPDLQLQGLAVDADVMGRPVGLEELNKGIAGGAQVVTGHLVESLSCIDLRVHRQML